MGPREGESKEGGPGLGVQLHPPQGDFPATAPYKAEGGCMKGASGVVRVFRTKMRCQRSACGGAARGRGGLLCLSLQQSELLGPRATRE